MSSLPVRILTAVLTFALGVGVNNLWLNAWSEPSITCRIPAVPRPARLELVFVLDTTGSMGGLLDGAKQRIWGIVNGVMQDSHSSVRIGLVAYRDRGDQYLTQVLPLTEDLDKVYTTLMDYQAAGGGDAPEDVRTALSYGVYAINWSDSAPDLSKIMFLVGDAPPHNDYDDVVDTLTSAANAVQKGIIVNTIQCGISGETERAWEAIATRGHGQYFAIPADGGVQAITTPYDDQLGELARQLGGTFVAYGLGSGAEGDAKRAEVASFAARTELLIDSAPASAKAERAVNKVISPVAYLGDLFQQLENGSVKLEDIDPAQLPEALRAMSPAERQQEIEKRLAQRRELRNQITLLSEQRYAYIEAEQKQKGGGEGFDVVVARALKQQMSRR